MCIVSKLFLAALACVAAFSSAQSLAADDPIAEALVNVTDLVRAGEVGYATVFEGNKFVQCRRWPPGVMRCEAGGSLMQPSLKAVLTPERLGRLGAEGWSLDPAFGHYVQVFPAHLTPAEIAARIRTALIEGYAADPSRVAASTQWVADVACPPRVSATQNLAGSVNGSPSMARVSEMICAYSPNRTEPPPQVVAAPDELVRIYGQRLTGEIQRLRVNKWSGGYLIVSAGIGYVQCTAEALPPALYCEAQSAESWAALASILTPERVAWLRNAGFSDPGLGPNYWKRYPLDGQADAPTASELLTLLFEVYGYRGASSLVFKTR